LGPWAYIYDPHDYNAPGGVLTPPGPQGTGYLKPAADYVVKSYLCPSDNAGPGNNDLLYLQNNGSASGILDGMGIWVGNDPNAGVPTLDRVYVEYVFDVPNFGRELGRSNYVGCGGAYGNITNANPADTVVTQWAPFVGIYY